MECGVDSRICECLMMLKLSHATDITNMDHITNTAPEEVILNYRVVHMALHVCMQSRTQISAGCSVHAWTHNIILDSCRGSIRACTVTIIVHLE